MDKTLFIDCTTLMEGSYVNSEKILQIIGLCAFQLEEPNMQLFCVNNGKKYLVLKKMLADFFMQGSVCNLDQYRTKEILDFKSNDRVSMGTNSAFNDWCMNPYTNGRFLLISEINIDVTGLYEKDCDNALIHKPIEILEVVKGMSRSSFIDRTVEKFINTTTYDVYVIDGTDVNIVKDEMNLGNFDSNKTNIIVLLEGDDVNAIYDYMCENVKNVVFYRKANIQTIFKLAEYADKTVVMGVLCRFFLKLSSEK